MRAQNDTSFPMFQMQYKSHCERLEEMRKLSKRRSLDTTEEINPSSGDPHIESSITSEAPTSTTDISTVSIPLAITKIDAITVATLTTTFESTLITNTESIVIAENGWNETILETNFIQTVPILQAEIMSATQTSSLTTAAAFITSEITSATSVADIETIQGNSVPLVELAEEPYFNGLNRRPPLLRDGTSAGSKSHEP